MRTVRVAGEHGAGCVRAHSSSLRSSRYFAPPLPIDAAPLRHWEVNQLPKLSPTSCNSKNRSSRHSWTRRALAPGGPRERGERRRREEREH